MVSFWRGSHLKTEGVCQGMVPSCVSRKELCEDGVLRSGTFGKQYKPS